MSDSELSSAPEAPSDFKIEQALRHAVHEALSRSDEITINLARSHAEAQLDLKPGYLKDSTNWKHRSKEIINGAVEDHSAGTEPVQAKSKPKKKTAIAAKRKSEEAQSVSKRRKKTAMIEPEEDEVVLQEASDIESRSDKPAPPSRDAHNNRYSTDLSDPPSDKPDLASNQPVGGLNDDESDLSSVIDDPPPKKKRQKKGSGSEPKPKHKSSTKDTKPAKAKTASKAMSPDDEEIKRLQGWLIKCGIRKLWHRELASCATDKDKIRHLKKLLTDVGMTGRYSVEKAKQVKEKRELAAELEAAQEFAEQWGHSENEDDQAAEGQTRPRRAAPKGLVDFGGSGDESE